MVTIDTDVLIVGSGIAGLSCALHLAEESPKLRIMIVSKAYLLESNTRYAQGGVAAVMYHPDHFEQHIQDTLVAGANLSDAKVVKEVIENAPTQIRHLLNWGVEFDLDPIGQFDLSREGGHFRHRVLHHKDQTGLEIAAKLLHTAQARANIQFAEHVFARSLHRGENGEVKGALLENTDSGELYSIHSHATILATGGIGQVYQTTSNPLIATGDGIALAFRAGAEISGMEFVQFHPTALYSPQSNPAFLITEALRGDGAQLLAPDGTRFMPNYHPLAELAPRHVVSKAIWEQCLAHHTDHLFLSCTSIPAADLAQKFPTILEACKQKGFNLSKDLIPIAPAAHYLCGGISTSLNGETNVEGLYALGECANTGLHGANRLASNSLLEALVMAKKCADTIRGKKHLSFVTRPALGSTKLNGLPTHVQENIKSTLRLSMQKSAGLVKSKSAMLVLLDNVHEWQQKTSSISSVSEANLANQLVVARLIIEHSLARDMSTGCFLSSN
jgi:L-aspartate oxidase